MTRQAIHDGLKDQHRNAIIQVLAAHPRIQRAILFGSRAMGTFSSASDIDIALVGDTLDATDLARLAGQMEELNVPQKVDLLLHRSIQSPQLLEHIEKHGVVVWERSTLDARMESCGEALPYGGPLPEGWEAMTLGEACASTGGSIQTGPFGSQLHASDYVPIGIPTVMPVNIGDNRILPNGIARVRPDDVERLSKHKLRRGDIVYSRRGDVERRALVSENEAGWLCGTGCLRIRFGERGSIDPQYASFFLGGEQARSWIVRHAVGATMPNLSTSILSALPFVAPPLPEQRRIAAVLGALDDKIELNRRMNQTLEAMAQALFKSWFIDFDGHTDLVDSELGPIPRGWRVAEIGSVVRVVGGSTPSTANPDYWEGGQNHWATPKDLSGATSIVLLGTERQITDAGVASISSGLMPPGTFLLSSRAPIGYVAISVVPVAINQGFIAIPPGGELSCHYLLQWVRMSMDAIKSRAGGTTFAEISKSAFRPMLVLVPPRDVMNRFDTLAGSLFERLVSNECQSRTLAALRDTLLPKLISGEIRVPEIEGLVEEAV